MKYLYCLLLLCACLSWRPSPAQNWRPFRPNGDVHAFRGAAADTILTLRLDSAGRQGPDSVYYFNRTMQRAGGASWRKSRNNQFGQQMRYDTAQRTYILFWDGGPTPILTLDKAWLLKPFARVGDTWTSISTDFGVQTTLLSRGTALIDGVQDSVATFQLGRGPGTQVVLSKSFGLVSAPKDFSFGFFAGVPLLTLARRPAPAGQSYYNPLTLLDLQPGDELGYELEAFSNGPFPCYTGWLLRRVLSRQVTADSISYSFQQQSRIIYSGAPNCTGSGIVISPVTMVRVAASRRTGEWRSLSTGVLLPTDANLLAYAYRPLFAGSNHVLIGYPVVSTRPGVSCSGPATLLQEALYKRLGTGPDYGPGLDALARQRLTAAGVGVVAEPEHRLVYTRRTSNGTIQTCGSRANFGTLLPTKAAQRDASCQLYPNPAQELAILKLAAPARAGATVQLLDGLGRIVSSQPLAPGQTTATLPLHELAAGVYLVELRIPGEAPQRLRLDHQQ